MGREDRRGDGRHSDGENKPCPLGGKEIQGLDGVPLSWHDEALVHWTGVEGE